MEPEKVQKRYRVESGRAFKLDRVDPGDTAGVDLSKDEADPLLKKCVRRLSDLQDMLYAQDRWSVLVIFQAMDAAGKDSAIKHVLSGVNPQGCEVHAFKAPSEEELDHDFLWRCVRRLPERGKIGVFNRSYYEEVLVVRVHEEILARQKLPPALVGKDIWAERYEDIAALERHLARNGTVVLKFFLHVSKEEQKKRFLARLDEPEKNWKFAAADVDERGRWDDYMAAYQDMIRATAAPHAPWYVIPADAKWFTRLVVAGAIVDALERLDLAFPEVRPAERRALVTARQRLERE